MVKVAVLASFNMDVVMRADRAPLPGETLQGDFASHLGGKGFNQAIAARRLGAEVAVVGRVGDDEFGRQFLAALERDDIDARGVVVDHEQGTGIAVITVTPDGENAIIQSPRANLSVTPHDIVGADGRHSASSTTDLLKSIEVPRLLQTANIALCTLETSLDAVEYLLHAALESSCSTVLNAAPASRAHPDVIKGVPDFLIVNQLEAAALTHRPCATADDALDAAKSFFVSPFGGAVVTLGRAGALAYSFGGRTFSPGFAVKAVDTTGAGDAFCGALAVRLAEGDDLPEAVRFACAAGAVACTRHGAEPSMPRRAEVEELLKLAGDG